MMKGRDTDEPRVAVRPGVVVFGVLALFVGVDDPARVAHLSSALGVLTRLGLPAGATEVSDIDVEAADGSMPEWATRSFRAPADAAALDRFFLDGCQRLGWVASSTRPAWSEGDDVWCEGSPAGTPQTLSASIRCDAAGCSVFVRVLT